MNTKTNLSFYVFQLIQHGNEVELVLRKTVVQAVKEDGIYSKYSY